jgi:RNA polymerase sigma factor (sigma-70 family)
METATHNDTELVAASLNGNRDAFGQIVARYQSLVCSLAYSATGSLDHSEDLAQETFVAAWKQLRELREPGKLRSWLCGIARNLINNWLRRQGREPSHAAEILDIVVESPTPEPLPTEQTIGREEKAILWHSLKRIQNARSARERKFLTRASWGILAWKVLLLAALLLAVSFTGGVVINQAKDAIGWSLAWVGLFGVWVAYSIWMTRRQRRIQMEDGTFEEAAALRFGKVDPTRKGFGAIVYGGLAAMIFGPGGLLIMVAGASGDRWAFGLLSVLAIAAWLACAGAIMRRPERIKRVFVAVWWGLALLTLATFNLRFHVWVNDPGQIWPDDPRGFHLPPLWLNIPILAFYGSIGLAWWLERRLVVSPALKRNGTGAA